MPFKDEELEKIAALFAEKLEAKLEKHRSAFGLSKDEMIILRRLIEDYTRRKQRVAKVIDGVLGALGIAFLLAVFTGLGYYVRNFISGGQ